MNAFSSISLTSDFTLLISAKVTGPLVPNVESLPVAVHCHPTAITPPHLLVHRSRSLFCTQEVLRTERIVEIDLDERVERASYRTVPFELDERWDDIRIGASNGEQ